LGGGLVGTAAQAVEAETVCTISDERLNEISGIAYSGLHEGVLWVHNDSGGGPRLYALDEATCDVLATLKVKDVEARDFEAMGTGLDELGRPVLWIADIGDNTAERKTVYVHRLPEPTDLKDQKVDADTYAIRYDKPANAEAIVVDDTAMWVITKGLASGTVEQLTLPLKSDGANRTESVGTEEGLVTDAAMSPDGAAYVVRDYTEARIYAGPPPGQLLARQPLPDQVQGEAVAWTPDGSALVIASENDNRILRVALPAAASAPPVAPDEVDSTPSEPASAPATQDPQASSARDEPLDDSSLAAPTAASTCLL